MCGRFASHLPVDAMASIFDAAPANDLPEGPDYNICPTQSVAVVVAGQGRRSLRAMRWGFLPTWYKSETDGPLLINARAETIAQKPAFAAACRATRCLIPASGFYEWTKTPDGKREPWYIAQADGEPTVFAGIWQVWEQGDKHHTTCAIVTTTASEPMSRVHKRMPVTLDPNDWPLWLGEQGKGAATLMHPAPNERFIFHRVDPAVNSNRAAGPALIDPLDGGKSTP